MSVSVVAPPRNKAETLPKCAAPIRSDLGLKPQVLAMIAGPAYEEFTQALHAAAENISSAA
jgi:hypothetical protein